MADLVNRLSWSNTRQKSYNRCLREYYWRAFGAWGGWRRAKASREAWLAYVFTKMKNLPMLVGELVHHEIERVLQAHQQGRRPPGAGESLDRLVTQMRQAWKESRDRRWEESPKHYHVLAEHYYKAEPEPDEARRLRDDATRCLRNFFELDLTRQILDSAPESIRTVEKLERFDFEGRVLHIKIDLAWESEGKLNLIDWKTGALDEEVDDQLAAYGFFASERWGIPYEKMTAYPVYLREPRVGDNCLRPEGVERLRNDVELYFAEVSGRLQSDHPPVAHPDAFPMTEELWKCRRCFFRELCGR